MREGAFAGALADRFLCGVEAPDAAGEARCFGGYGVVPEVEAVGAVAGFCGGGGRGWGGEFAVQKQDAPDGA